MAKRLYVGNLAYTVIDADLLALFEEYGTVRSAQVLKDRETNRSRGFGFVEMDNDDEADNAISAPMAMITKADGSPSMKPGPVPPVETAEVAAAVDMVGAAADTAEADMVGVAAADTAVVVEVDTAEADTTATDPPESSSVLHIPQLFRA